MESVENIAPAVVKLVSRQMLELANRPPEGILILINEDNVTDIQAWIGGPDDTPYESGYFRVKVVLVSDFPASPPKCFFLTKIFHPNISETGEVCVNSLKKDWRREYGIAHILLIVRALLYQPNPESALNQEAAMTLNADHDAFVREAKLMTSIHALHVPPDVRRALEPADGNKNTGGSGREGSSAQGPTQVPRKRRVGVRDPTSSLSGNKKKKPVAAGKGTIGGLSSKAKDKPNSPQLKSVRSAPAAGSAGADVAGIEKKRSPAGRHDEENIGERVTPPARERTRRA